VIAVAKNARGRDQRGQAIEQFQRCQAQLRAAIGLRLVEAIDDLLVAGLLEPLQSRGRPRAVAQQPLQSGAVSAVDAHRSIQGETPAVIPARHVARIGGTEMAGTREPMQHTYTAVEVDMRIQRAAEALHASVQKHRERHGGRL
jgi:hypothetical protein